MMWLWLCQKMTFNMQVGDGQLQGVFLVFVFVFFLVELFFLVEQFLVTMIDFCTGYELPCP